MRSIQIALSLAMSLAPPTLAAAKDVVLFGAGSLRDALTEVTRDWSAKSGVSVRTAFGPSGLMRERIEAGEAADVFASADMQHPLRLRVDGKAKAVVMFARNQLCAFAPSSLQLTPAGLVDVMLDAHTKLGTSTPGSDPSGDYTWEMFRAIERTRLGSFAALDHKAMKIVGGTATTADPDPVATAFRNGAIDMMIGYCSGAAQRAKANPDVGPVPIPSSLSAGAEYGLAVMNLDNTDAVSLAFAIMSPDSQAILRRYGFTPVAAPASNDEGGSRP